MTTNETQLLAAAKRLSYLTGSECPECGAKSNEIEDNGGTEYRCKCCDHRWGTDGGEEYGL